jgi:hypothetical protein
MQVTMDDEDHGKLIQHVSDFVWTALSGTRHTLCEFQELEGWINWFLNVYPLLKPALSNVYDKISGKSQLHALIFVSKAVTDDLSWFISHVESSYGIRVFEATDWSADEVDVTAYGDASSIGMGFYFAESKSGFQSVLPHDPTKDVIFFFKALTVLCIVQIMCSRPSIPKRLVVFSDNMNTVDIFSSLHTKPCYNTILKPTVSLLLQHHLDLRVIHIPGEDNIIVDSLSCFRNSQALATCPGLSISPFQPP